LAAGAVVEAVAATVVFCAKATEDSAKAVNAARRARFIVVVLLAMAIPKNHQWL
jgi:hypothetical protein